VRGCWCRFLENSRFIYVFLLVLSILYQLKRSVRSGIGGWRRRRGEVFLDGVCDQDKNWKVAGLAAIGGVYTCYVILFTLKKLSD
jgi:hypothetical protein